MQKLIARSLASIFIVLLNACGGGGGSNDATAPQVSQTTPLDAATDVTRGTVISAVFDEDILPTSVDSNTVLLTLNSQGVAGSVSFDGATNTASLTPSSPLALLGAYTASVTTGISDLSGNALAADQSWSFTVVDGQWRSAELIETADTGSARGPQIATDTSGNALAVWEQSDGTRDNIWSNRYTAGSGWSSPELIETDDMDEARKPQIAIDALGNALAVWEQSDSGQENIWSNRYTTGSGWGSAELIETDNDGAAIEPQIAIDASGNALAVWQQSDGTRFDIWSNRYTAGSGWGSAELIETDDTDDARDPQIAIDASGNALAVWQQSDLTRDNIWSNRYTAGSGWGSAELIETDNDGNATSPQITTDVSGNALAVWEQSDGTRFNIWSNRYTAGSGWGSAELIETDDGDAFSPQIATDASGNALAVWLQLDSTRFDIWSNRYTAGSSWGSAELIETDNAGEANNPQITTDASGNALAVWQQRDSTRDNIWSNRYTADSGWGSAEMIEADNEGRASDPQIAIDTSGNALAVWRQRDSTRDNIWANRFD